MSFATFTGTVADLFHQLGLYQWWQSPTQTFGVNGELGTDYAMQANQPVGAIEGGQVVNVFHSGPVGSSIGYIVQVRSPDGSLWHYQHLRDASVRVGQTIPAGATVGHSGGCPEGGYAEGGWACTWTDPWSTGPHIEVRWAPSFSGPIDDWHTAGDQPWQDSAPHIEAAALSQPLGGLGGVLAWLYGYGPGTSGGRQQGDLQALSDLSRSSGDSASHGKHNLHISAFLPGMTDIDIDMDPAIDFTVRGGLITVGVLLIIVGVFLLTRPDKKLEAAAPELAMLA